MALTAEQISARGNTYKGLGINFGMPQSSGSPTPPPQGAAPQINRTGSDPNMMYASSAPQESRPVDAPRGYTAEANPAPANSVPFRTDQPSQGQDTIQQGMDMWNNASKMPVAASNATPAPQTQSQGSFPGQLSNSQIYAEAQARIAKQRAAITGATNAANAARKNVFDYTNQLTNDNRTLRNADFNENSNPFSGRTGYLASQNFRNDSIQDTANNNAYQSDITANNQKVTDFETLAPEQQQALIDQLTRTERDYGLQLGALTGQVNGQSTLAKQGQDAQYTGQYGGQPTLQAQNQNFQQNLATNQDNRAAQGQGFNQNMQTNQFNAQQAQIQWDNAFKNKQFDQTTAQQLWDNTFKDNSFKQSVNQFSQQMGLDYSKMSQSQQQFVADQAFKNKSLELQQNKQNYDQNPNNPDNVYKLSQAARDNALAIKAGNDAQKNAIDTAYKDAVGLAQRDQLFNTYDPAKQASIIDGYYQHLKPAQQGALSDQDISSYLNKK